MLHIYSLYAVTSDNSETVEALNQAPKNGIK